MENPNKSNEYKVTLEHRITKIESSVDNLCKKINEIKDNHLVHLQNTVDILQSKITYGLWFVVITLVTVIVNMATRSLGV